MCTVEEMEDYIRFNDKDLDTGGIIIDDKINNTFGFYSDVFTFNDRHYYVFVQIMSRSTHTRIPQCWILLDSQSTVDLFCNSELLTNIRTIKEELVVSCYTGTARTNIVTDLKGYGTVWYYDDGIIVKSD